MSVVANGPLAGEPLEALVGTLGERLVGTAAKPGPFPLLIKILDAADRTSFQVHPDEDQAAALGGEPKTELWYALPGSEEAGVWVGFRTRVEGEGALERAIRGGVLEELLNYLPLRPGDAVFIPGGRAHAIGAGCLLLEIQQNSDTTYRVFDWGRLGEGGKPRPLHLEQAMKVIRWDDLGARPLRPRKVEETEAYRRSEIHVCPHFSIHRLELSAPVRFEGDPRSFRALFVEEGSLYAEGGGVAWELPAGTTCLLPAALSECRLAPGAAGGAVRVIEITL
jgi:mannose-6-phosphate isomerase